MAVGIRTVADEVDDLPGRDFDVCRWRDDRSVGRRVDKRILNERKDIVFVCRRSERKRAHVV